jgi:hypothetical protein
MNFRRGAPYLVLLGLAALCAAFFPVRPVEAASPSASLLPARFLLQILPLNPGSFALQTASAAKKSDDTALPEGKGRDLALKDCTNCHAVSVWTKKHHTREEWSSVIEDMVAKGLNAPDEDLDTITDYLAAHFGPTKSVPPSPAPEPQAAPPPQ